MKARTIGIVAAAGLAALIGGCKVKHEACQPYYDKGYAAGLQEGLAQCPLAEQPEQILPQPQERIWTEVLDNVYFLNDKPGSELPDAIFTAGGNIVNLDSLWVKNPNEVYADYGRDGIVDEVASSVTGTRYYRNAETADLFRRADAALAQAKAEIGLD